MKWEEMTARQRDVLVAEKVMGWQWWHWVVTNDGELVQALFAPSDDTSWIGERHLGKREHARIFESTTPRYTTDIAAAWQVKTALTEQGYVFYFDTESGPSACFRGQDQDYDEMGYSDAFTDSEAICLAALRAKGVEV
jgi:hypothetical protein